MENLKMSLNGQKLIQLYEEMAREGISRADGKFVKDAYPGLQKLNLLPKFFCQIILL